MDVSVIIPVFNEEKFIEMCHTTLLSYLKSSGLDYEIIVIDNGSDDRTPEILRKLSETSIYPISRSSISFARNFGASKSKGKILAFIDGDIVVNQKWIETLKSFCRLERAPFLSGFEVLVREDPSWVEKFWFGNLASNHINSANLIISKSSFDMLRGFDERLKTGEDYDLCVRAKSIADIKYCPVKSFEAIHLGYPSSLGGFMKREIWHGEGDFSSVKVFLTSKVAMLSVMYVLIQVVAIILLISGFYFYGVVLFVFIFFINLAITVARFKGKSINTILVNSFLNYMYFLARFSSLFRNLVNRRRIY